MPINHGLSHLSALFFLITIVVYSMAVVAYAGDFAFGRRRPARGEAGADGPAPELVPAGAAVGQAGAVAAPDALAARGPGAASPYAARQPGDTPAAGGGGKDAGRAAERPGRWIMSALILTGLGLTAHILGVVTRGLAVHRVPWGDMYEFVTAVTCVAVIFFFGLMLRYRVYRLGLFVLGPVVVLLGIAETVIYTPAQPLVPALMSYWLAIHVTAITLATGAFVGGALFTVVYLLADRHERRVAAGLPTRAEAIFRALPGIKVIDRLSYRLVVFGFPMWTFGIIAGAIWADEAWGRYWGWDPTETWAFITWVVYAGYLHARATAGWRGRRSAYIQLIAFGCLLFNVTVISLLVPGLHSYAGLT